MLEIDKIEKLIDTLKVIIKNPSRIARIFDSDEYYYRTCILKKWRGLKDGLPVIDLLDLFPRLEETVSPYSYLRGAAQPIDLALLRALARRYNPCQYLEIGAWRGESAANIAEVADECVSVDLSEAEMRQSGSSDEFITKVRGFFSKNLKNVRHILHNSQTLDFSALGGKFDLVFIDGDHNYQGVKMDTENAFKTLRNSSSVIVWHDYKRITESVRWEVFAGILDGCPEEKIDNLYHINNTFCAIYMEGDFKTRNVVLGKAPYEVPDKNFSIKISVQPISVWVQNKEKNKNFQSQNVI